MESNFIGRREELKLLQEIYESNEAELLKKTKLPSGGTSSRMIEDLVDAGFLIYSFF